MDLQLCFDFINFWYKKNTGSYFTVSELEQVIDRGQMSLYEDLQPKYATSQRIKDALVPFRDTYDFNSTNTVSGYIVVPSNRNYLNLLDVQVHFGISGREFYVPVHMINEDERAHRLNSQIDPVTTSAPIGEMTAPRYIKLYPTSGYTGTVTFLRRPVIPVFNYTLISGRVIVYNQEASTQLEWPENWITPVLIKALQNIGINLGSADLVQWSEAKSAQNYQSVNMI
jgi:hypothetical protein